MQCTLYKGAAACFALAIGLLSMNSQATAQSLGAPNGLNVLVTIDSGITWNPATGEGNYMAKLNWNPGSGSPTGYNIWARRIGRNSFLRPRLLMRTTEPSATLQQDTSFDIGSDANAIYVTAYDDNGESDPSNVVSTVYGESYNDGDFAESQGKGTTRIVSTPPATARVGQTYTYDPMVLAELTYTQSTNISYSLQNGVTGMKVDPQTGVIAWTPTAPGTYSIYLKTQNTEANESSHQTWTIEVTSGVSSVPQRLTAEETSVYPNPASAGINFNFAATAGTYDLAVIDVAGRTIYSSELNAKAGTNHLALDTRTFDPGLYVLRVTNSAEARTIPFSVVR